MSPQLGSQATISVAMCTYNGSRHLSEQLATIAQQTRLPLELVVTDDGSTDDTLELLQQFARTCSFPVHVHSNPQRLGSTRNFDRAIRLCTGDYIALCDQDDRWLPGKMAVLAAMLDERPAAAMVFSDATLIDDRSKATGQGLWESLRFGGLQQRRFQHDAGALLLERPVVTGATMLFRRALLERFAEIPAEWVHDGWITWMSVLWAEALFTGQRLTEYRVHASQQLGVGETSLAGRIAHIRGRQREFYARAAAELGLLYRYVAQQAPALPRREHWLHSIAQAQNFFALRADAPAGVAGRVRFLLRHLPAYRALEIPTWRVLLRDLLMSGGK